MTVTLKPAVLPVLTVRLAGFVRMIGALISVSVATELVALPELFVTMT